MTTNRTGYVLHFLAMCRALSADEIDGAVAERLNPKAINARNSLCAHATFVATWNSFSATAGNSRSVARRSIDMAAVASRLRFCITQVAPQPPSYGLAAGYRPPDALFATANVELPLSITLAPALARRAVARPCNTIVVVARSRVPV